MLRLVEYLYWTPMASHLCFPFSGTYTGLPMASHLCSLSLVRILGVVINIMAKSSLAFLPPFFWYVYWGVTFPLPSFSGTYTGDAEEFRSLLLKVFEETASS